MSRLLLRFWLPNLILFILLTLFYLNTNEGFRTSVSDQVNYPKLGVEKPKRLHPQVFTPPTNPQGRRMLATGISPEQWREWNRMIDSQEGARSLYRRSFLIDNVWALSLISLIYTLSLAFRRPTHPRVLPGLSLLFAYLSDLLENFTYLGFPGGLERWLPQICTLKYGLYLLGILLSLTCFLGDLITHRKASP